MSDQPTFKLDEAIAAQKALRREMGLKEETFLLPAFIGMIGDEIGKMRERGRSDDEIATFLSTETGKTITAADIGQHYDPSAPGR